MKYIKNVYTYFDLLKAIKNEEIDSQNLKTKDTNDNVWVWSDEDNFLYLDTPDDVLVPLSDKYSDFDLLDIKFIVLTHDEEDVDNNKSNQTSDLKQIKYVDLLQAIKENNIDVENYMFLDNNGRAWEWSNDIKGFKYNESPDTFYDDGYINFITSEYDELDLVNLMLTIVPREQIQNIPQISAKKSIIEHIENLYMDLDMEIDNCQGCMDGLDEAFEKLHIYKDIVEFLGGDIDAHIQELTDKWFEKAELNRQKEQKEQQKRDEVIKKLPISVLDLMSVDETIRNILWKQNDKINEICEILIKNKTNN